MKRKKRRDESAAPRCPGHALQQQKQNDRAQGVNGHIHHVRAAGAKTKNLAVKHVRQPRQRMPVDGITNGCESPRNVRRRKTVTDVDVLGHIFFVVEPDEAVRPHRPIDDERESD